MKNSPVIHRLTGPKARTMRLLREAARELLRTGDPLTVSPACHARLRTATSRTTTP
jgi:hypothetical protein